MADFLGTPKIQYFYPGTSNPLVGGQLFTYNIDMTTPRATYPSLAAAAAGTPVNTNPVILDANGQADVVISGSTGLILKDINNNVIWTEPAVGTTGSNIYDPNGNLIIDAAYVSNAVNQVTITNAVTGSAPSVAATGGDNNINLNVLPKGTGGVNLGTNIIDANNNTIITLTPVASAVNYIDIDNSITATNPSIKAKGSDANIGIQIVPKGTGQVKISANNFPAADGTVGQFLMTDGASNLSFFTILPPTGAVIQTVSTTKTDIFSGSFTNSTAPASVTGLAATITPSNALSKVLITVNMGMSANTADLTVLVDLTRNTNLIGIGTVIGSRTSANMGVSLRGTNSGIQPVSFSFLDSPGSTSAVTYQVVIGQVDTSSSCLLGVNVSATDTNAAGFLRTASTITVQELQH